MREFLRLLGGIDCVVTVVFAIVLIWEAAIVDADIVGGDDVVDGTNGGDDVVDGADGVNDVVDGADGVNDVVDGADGVNDVVDGAAGVSDVVDGADGGDGTDVDAAEGAEGGNWAAGCGVKPGVPGTFG